tara:strand:- start:454 stop:846 length:393 start_codon:yes stop_codon:yes gene_type:complete
MTIKEIVMQVANTYTLNNRSTENHWFGDECEYRMGDGRMCAVGMCMNEPSLEEFGNSDGDVYELHKIVKNQRNEQGLDYLLKEEYKGHPLEFWAELQRLHDNWHYWDEYGLNESGKRQANLIIDEYSDGR